MLATFCLRLACGLIGSLLLLSVPQVNPRFFRVHFLIALGLTAVTAAAERHRLGKELWLALIFTAILTLIGSLVWSLEGTPGGRSVVVLSVFSLVGTLAIAAFTAAPEIQPRPYAWRFLGELTSAALLGTATSAMLMGHSYLIAPTMSLTPLLRLLGALFIVTVLRMIVAGLGLWSWTAEHSLFNLEDETVLWLPVRWGLGFLGPLGLGWMAWSAARIRSTQSATGILYVVVIFCFLGELTSQLLQANTGYIL